MKRLALLAFALASSCQTHPAFAQTSLPPAAKVTVTIADQGASPMQLQ